MPSLRRIGLQRRIMLYVVLGLAVMSAVVAVLGLEAIDQATDLVFRERLATAHATARVLERDLDRFALEVRTALADPAAGLADDSAASLGDRLLGRLRDRPDAEPVTLLAITGVVLGGPSGVVLARSDTVDTGSEGSPPPLGEPPAPGSHDVVGWPSGSGDRGSAALRVRLDSPTAMGIDLVVVRAVGLDSSEPYDPAGGGAPGSSTPPAGDVYNLEVLDTDGRGILAVGPVGPIGHGDRHSPAMSEVMEVGRAATIIDPGDATIGLEPHVMAAVPIRSTSLYLVLEQPVDVALALPNQLRERLFTLIAVGIVITLVVAWFTTRHVVKPTEALTKAAGRIAAGDLTSPIEVTAEDEVGALAESLEQMRSNLASAHAQLATANEELERRVAERTARLGQVLRRTIRAQEEERYALARELHDETAQTLAALSVALDRARDDLSGGSSDTRVHIQQAKEIASRLLAETRRMILGLRPSVLDDLGLVPAIRWYAEATFDGTGVAWEVRASGAQGRLPGHLEVALFRIAQEAINNVARHAAARTATIEVDRAADRVQIRVVDDGVGFDLGDAVGPGPTPGQPSGSVGLVGMHERVALLGGRLVVDTQPGAGTRILVHVPIVEEPVP